MNINQIKQQIAQITSTPCNALTMQQQKDEQGVHIPWVTHWDNIGRIRVGMHLEVFNAIMANPANDKLALQHEIKESEKGQFHSFTVITPQDVLGTF